jgi:hypothetical protein
MAMLRYLSCELRYAELTSWDWAESETGYHATRKRKRVSRH